MKYDLYPIIIKGLKEVYSLEDNYSTLELYKYINIRCSIVKSSKKFSDTDLINFILKDLNITKFEKGYNNSSFAHVKYKDDVYLNYKWISSFLENMRFRASLEGNLCYKDVQNEVFVKGYRKARKYKDLDVYKKYITYYRLIELNNFYSAEPISTAGIEGFERGIEHNPFKRTEEEVLEAELETSRFMSSNTTSYITEEKLEDYLYFNIEVIEEGMSVIDRQVDIDGGVIDLLAVDSKGNVCIIELKINQDKNIVWQTIHYKKEIRKKYKNKDVRVLTVAPRYDSYISEALQELGYVEMFSYDILVSKGEITNLNVLKIVN